MTSFGTCANQHMLGHFPPSTFWSSVSADQLSHIFPEFAATKNVFQRGGKSVFWHSLDVLDKLPIKNSVTLWSAVVHDIGKVAIPCDRHNPTSPFRGHEKVSAEIATHRLAKFDLNPELIESVVRVVRHHMLDIKGDWTNPAVRNFVARIGRHNIGHWFALRRADAAVYSGSPSSPLIDAFEARITAEITYVNTIQSLAITDADIAEAIGSDEPDTISRIHGLLVEAVYSLTCSNDHDTLLLASKLYATTL